MPENKHWTEIDDPDIARGSVWTRRAGKGTRHTVSVVVVDRSTSSDKRIVVRTRSARKGSHPYSRDDFLDKFELAPSSETTP